MAMNKKELAELEAAKLAAIVNRALRWTDPVEPDLAPPASAAQYTNGYLVWGNGMDPRVIPSWSGVTSHGSGHRSTATRPSSATQGPRRLYSTNLLALRALRHTMELNYANLLAMVDRRIADAVAEEAAKSSEPKS